MPVYIGCTLEIARDHDRFLFGGGGRIRSKCIKAFVALVGFFHPKSEDVHCPLSGILPRSGRLKGVVLANWRMNHTLLGWFVTFSVAGGGGGGLGLGFCWLLFWPLSAWALHSREWFSSQIDRLKCLTHVSISLYLKMMLNCREREKSPA